MNHNTQTASPLISVIVPVYNVAAYLPRCLDSIIRQTYRHLEIILVDDGSTDDCLKICKEFAAKDSRIKVIHQENQGVSAARNRGLDNAQGEFITFVDADDGLTPQACEKLLTVQQKTNADMVTANLYFAPPDVPAFEAIPPQHFTSLELNLHDVVSICVQFHFFSVARLYRTSALFNLRFNPKYPLGEDVDFLFRVIDKIQKFAYLSAPIYYYYSRPHSAASTLSIPARIGDFEIWGHVESLCKKYGFQDLGKKVVIIRVSVSILLLVSIILYDLNNQYSSSLLEVRSYLLRHWKLVLRWHCCFSAKVFLLLFIVAPLFTRSFCRLPGVYSYLQKGFQQIFTRPKKPNSN